jgi:hypothetical protein
MGNKGAKNAKTLKKDPTELIEVNKKTIVFFQNTNYFNIRMIFISLDGNSVSFKKH